MKRLPLALYLGILLASMLLAYGTWTRRPAASRGEVALLSCDAGGLRKVIRRGKDTTVVFDRRAGRAGEGPSWWVEVTRLEAPPPGAAEEKKGKGEEKEKTASEAAGAGEPAGGPQKRPAARRKVEVFKGNEKLGDLLEGFCSWKALRRLGKVKEPKRKEFGLADSPELLVLELGSQTRKFRIGGATYGPRDRYVEDEQSGEVFLVEGRPLRETLHPQGRFMERDLHAFGEKAIDGILVEAEGGTKELVRKESEGGEEGAGWAEVREGAEPTEAYANWVRQTFALRAVGYLGPDDGVTPGGGCTPPPGTAGVAHLTFHKGDREIGYLFLYRRERDGKGTSFFACTEHTEGLVKVPSSLGKAFLGATRRLFGRD